MRNQALCNAPLKIEQNNHAVFFLAKQSYTGGRIAYINIWPFCLMFFCFHFGVTQYM